MREPIFQRRIPLALVAGMLLVGPFGSQAAEEAAPRRPAGTMRPTATPEATRPAPAPTQRRPEAPTATPGRKTPEAPKAAPEPGARTLRPDAARGAAAEAAGDEQAARKAVEESFRRQQSSVERKARELEGASERFAQKQRSELERENASTLARIRGLAKSSGRIEELRERVRALEKEAASASPDRGARIAEEADALLEEYEGLVGAR